MFALVADGVHVSKNGLEVAVLVIAIVIGLLILLGKIRRP